MKSTFLEIRSLDQSKKNTYSERKWDIDEIYYIHVLASKVLDHGFHL